MNTRTAKLTIHYYPATFMNDRVSRREIVGATETCCARRAAWEAGEIERNGGRVLDIVVDRP